MACAVMIGGLTTADVFGRYFFNRPITGTYEITESYLMVSLVFFGLCTAYREGWSYKGRVFHKPYAIMAKDASELFRSGF